MDRLVKGLLLVALLLTGCVTVKEKEDLEMQPMYGLPDQARDPYLVSEDEAFKTRQLTRFKGDHKAASRSFSTKANEHLGYGELHQAMVNFNRAWLLDSENAHVYWGFGQVMAVRGEMQQAIGHLSRAEALGVDAFQKPALLVDLGISYSILAERLREQDANQSQLNFFKANSRFSEAAKLDPRYGEIWRRWAFSLYREQRYQDAWGAVKKARSLGAKQMPGSFIDALSEQMPEPE